MPTGFYKRIDRKIKTNCIQCDKMLRFAPSTINAGRKCCSYSCRQKYLWNKTGYREKMSKSHIGKISYGLPYLIAFSKSEQGRKFNSERQKGRIPWNKGKECPQFSGENNYKWIHDRTQLKMYGDSEKRRSPRYKYWSREVKNRDGWKCKISNDNCSGRLESHHILGFTEYPELRYEINNGITLCHFHHPRKREDEKKLSPYFQKLVAEMK